MRDLNLKEIMSKSNMNQQGLNIATYGQAYFTKLFVKSGGGRALMFKEFSKVVAREFTGNII